MKIRRITSTLAALAASVAIPSGAATLEQALNFDLVGNVAGKTTVFHGVKSTPDVTVRITTKDIISLLADTNSVALRNAQLLILSDFTGTNTSVTPSVVIRHVKGQTNDLDVTSFFKFETLTNFPITTTGRTDTNSGAILGTTVFKVGRVVIQDGTNAPLLTVRGYEIENTRPETVKVAQHSVAGVAKSWELISGTGAGRTSLGEAALYGGVSATIVGVSP